jgi:precorrin-2 dehydrogenase/sirohydrochlorin ferrochelatase
VRHAYPILLDVTDRPVVIVGGGPVAVRKAKGVLEAGATRVRVVSPTIDAAMPPEVERVEASYEPAHLEGAGLVFAATDLPAVNDSVVRDARARGVLVSRADAADESAGDFTVPAHWRSGPATLAVSAGGSPALAVTIRDGLLAHWDDRWTRMAELMLVFRSQFRAAPDIGPATRREIYRDLAGEEALDVLAREGVEGVIDWLRRKYPGLSSPRSEG